MHMSYHELDKNNPFVLGEEYSSLVWCQTKCLKLCLKLGMMEDAYTMSLPCELR